MTDAPTLRLLSLGAGVQSTRTSVAKSACVGFPFHGNRGWRERRDTCQCGHHRNAHDDNGNGADAGLCGLCGCPWFDNPEWRDVVAFDHAIRRGGARGASLEGEAFLHASRVPLDQAPIDYVTAKERHERAVTAAGYPTQLNMFDLLENGDPDGCSPYGCRSGEPVG